MLKKVFHTGARSILRAFGILLFGLFKNSMRIPRSGHWADAPPSVTIFAPERRSRDRLVNVDRLFICRASSLFGAPHGSRRCARTWRSHPWRACQAVFGLRLRLRERDSFRKRLFRFRAAVPRCAARLPMLIDESEYKQLPTEWPFGAILEVTRFQPTANAALGSRIATAQRGVNWGVAGIPLLRDAAGLPSSLFISAMAPAYSTNVFGQVAAAACNDALA
jgi:hypothetical protein